MVGLLPWPIEAVMLHVTLFYNCTLATPFGHTFDAIP